MDKENINKAELFVLIKSELESQLKMGIMLTVDGRESTPDQIAGLCAFREGSNYMRDYVLDENGNIVEIGFNDVHDK